MLSDWNDRGLSSTGGLAGGLEAINQMARYLLDGNDPGDFVHTNSFMVISRPFGQSPGLWRVRLDGTRRDGNTIRVQVSLFEREPPTYEGGLVLETMG